MNSPIKCSTCGNRHWTPREVMACAQFGPVANWKPPVEPITPRQLGYITDLGGDRVYAMKLSKNQASIYIDQLKHQRVASTPHNPAQTLATLQQVANQPPVWPLQTPEAMVKTVRDGRYAVRHDENEDYKFVRISRPKVGRKKGALVIQSQHSDFYKDCVIVWPSGKVMVIDKRVDPYLLLVVVDPVTAARKYGQELGVCCCCGRELTDGRSIHFGIGPECEKKWPEIIDAVIDEKGDFRA